MTARVLFFGTVLAVLPGIAPAAELKPASIFGNGMVVQRDVPLPVWGRAAAGAEVVVTLGEAQAKSTADPQGFWQVELPPSPAGGPVAMEIKSGDTSLKFADVLIGDVWLCAGGVGMDRNVGSSPSLRELVAEPPPGIRIALIPGQIASRKSPGIRDVRWSAAGMSLGVASFSGAAIAFALEMQRTGDAEGKVPIGLIQATSVNSLTSSWAGREALEADPETRPIMEQYDAAVAAYLEASRDYIPKFKAWTAAMAEAEKTGDAWPPGPAIPPEPRSDPRKPCGFFYGMIAPLAPFPIKGVLWSHGELDVPQPAMHARVFAALVQSWRDAWKAPSLPVFFTQIGKAPNPDAATEAAWAAFRAAQESAAAIPQTVMVPTLDVEGQDPAAEFGRRLAKAAASKAPGKP